MALFLGFDSSTQSLKATAIGAQDLQVYKRYVINFDQDLPHFKTSGGMSASSTSTRITSPVLMWIEALDLILEKMKADNFPFDKVLALSGSGQQHGSVYWAQGAAKLLESLDPTTTMKARAMKKKAVSKIARGKLAKVMVFKGNKEKTSSGAHRSDLMKNKRNKVVSKKQNAAGKKAYKNICGSRTCQWKPVEKQTAVSASQNSVSTKAPTGDPLSPLVLVVMMHALQVIVETRVGDPKLRHFIYMDDRTAVASSKLVVKETQLAWCDVAAEYHLLENADKAQFVDISRRKDSFEVLGSLLGAPKDTEIRKSKMANRLSKASELYRKIRFLPESYAQRMKDVKRNHWIWVDISLPFTSEDEGTFDCFVEELGQDTAQKLAPQLAQAFARAESPIWADSSTGVQCARVESKVGRERLAKATGARAYERFTGMQIAKIIEEEPAIYAKCEHISLVSSAMCSILLGSYAPVDTSDGSGTNLNNLQDLGGLSWFGPALAAVTPDVAGLRRRLGPGLCVGHQALGSVASYFATRYGLADSCLVVAWSGDNPCSLAGLGLQEPGDVAISLGTSDTMFAVMGKASPGEDGMVLRNPVDPASFMGMLVFKNGSLSREQVRKEHCDGAWDRWEKMLAETPPGNNGAIGFYFHSPEITPTTGERFGIFRFDENDKEVSSFPSAVEVRAVVESKFMAMRGFAQGIGMESVKRIIATGGASSNRGILQVIADVFGVPVYTLEQSDSASLGAALRAAHAYRCACEGRFVAFADVVAGKIDYKSAATPTSGAEEVYGATLPRYLRLQQKLLDGFKGGDCKRART
eukprot:symbB.v1.2.006929.t2/scaffold400.1/size211454/8